MVLSAAATHRVFVDDAQAGRGLSGIENAGFRAVHGFDKLAGDSRDATHALQEIQNHTLARKYNSGVMTNDRD